jgi:hypothetical protein
VRSLDANDGSGQRGYTAENALVFAHPVGDPTFAAYEEGALLTTLRGVPLDGTARIDPPAELVIADRPHKVDTQLAGAFYKAFAHGDDGRRLILTAQWTQIASRNTTMVGPGVRVIALRSGFETLLDAGSDYVTQGDVLHQLVEKPTARRWPRTWKTLKGKTTTANLTPLQWWFYNFGFLRNKIAHGAMVHRGDWRWKGEHHLAKAEWELRRAMRSSLVRLGHDSLLEIAFSERERLRRAQQVAAILRRHGL